MTSTFESFEVNELIPARDYLKNKKLEKYFSRETAAAFVCVGKLLKNRELDPLTPFYYSHGIVDFESYGLDQVSRVSLSSSGEFSNRLFIQEAMPLISPLTQFKVLYNMSQCFISIELGLKGDSAAVYSSAYSLLYQALYAPKNTPILIGAGKIYKDGKVETAFALTDKKEINEIIHYIDQNTDAIDFFKKLKSGSYA